MGNIVRTDVDVAQHYYMEYAAHLFLTLTVVLKRDTGGNTDHTVSPGDTGGHECAEEGCDS